MRNVRSKPGPACSTMTHVPDDIILSVVCLRLPAKSVARFRCVCKSWCSSLTDPKFFRKHNNHITKSKIPFKLLTRLSARRFITSVEDISNLTEPIRVAPRKFPKLKKSSPIIRGAANGFVLVGVNYNILVIWNPTTGDYKMVPDPCNPPYNKYDHVGFGYDSSIDDYKIVRVVPFARKEADVYSLKSNSWRKIQHNFPESTVSFNVGEYPYAVDGAVIWMQSGSESAILLKFDVKEDKFGYLLLPRRFNLLFFASKNWILEVSYSTGRIYKWVLKMIDENNRLVWVPEAMVVPSQPFSLPSCIVPLCPLKNGKFLMYHGISKKPRLLIYDHESCLLNDCHIPGFQIDRFNQHILYVETLVSPNAWGG